VFYDGLEHEPGGVGEGRVACYAVEDEEGFDSFGSTGEGSLVMTRGGRRRVGLPEDIACVFNIADSRN
jgi:hypothetical protein